MKKFEGLNASNEYDIGTFAEFGMRRRYSSDMQDWLVKYIVDQKIPGFVGTSNVYLAKKYGVKSIGTCAHEMGMTLMTDQQYNCAYVNDRLMKVWTDVYGTKNGIYLTDLIGRKPFLMDFNDRYATLFSGVRHDSGDPIEWGEDMIAHYKKLGIDPMTKTLLFSDSLDFERATKIYKHFVGRIKIAFGIGTFLSNDTDVGALNIVMKVVKANGYPTCKLTDNPEKAMGDNQEYIDFVKRSVDWRIRYEK
jgi:nicotinate phosphoribosyltransferase